MSSQLPHGQSRCFVRKHANLPVMPLPEHLKNDRNATNHGSARCGRIVKRENPGAKARRRGNLRAMCRKGTRAAKIENGANARNPVETARTVRVAITEKTGKIGKATAVAVENFQKGTTHLMPVREAIFRMPQGIRGRTAGNKVVNTRGNRAAEISLKGAARWVAAVGEGAEGVHHRGTGVHAGVAAGRTGAAANFNRKASMEVMAVTVRRIHTVTMWRVADGRNNLRSSVLVKEQFLVPHCRS